jgi:hypothetical protein
LQTRIKAEAELVGFLFVVRCTFKTILFIEKAFYFIAAPMRTAYQNKLSCRLDKYTSFEEQVYRDAIGSWIND